MDYEFWCDEERLGRNRNPEDKKYIDNYTKKNTEKYIQHRVLADISTIIGLFAALYVSIFSK